MSATRTPPSESRTQNARLTPTFRRVAYLTRPFPLTPHHLHHATTLDRRFHHPRLHPGDARHRILHFQARQPEPGELLPRGQRDPLARPGPEQRLGDVRHQRDDVDAHALFRLRPEERLHPLAVANVQPDLPDDLPVRLAPQVGSDDGGGVDSVSVRKGDGGGAEPPHRGRLRHHRRDHLRGLRVHRYREVRHRISALGAGGRPAAERDLLRADHYGRHVGLRHQGRDVLGRLYGGAAVLHHDGGEHRGGHHRHDAGEPGVAGPVRPRRLARHLLRLGTGPGLVRHPGIGQRQDRRGRLGVVHDLLHARAAEGHPAEHGRPGPELRYAAHPLHADAEGSRQDVRFRKPRAPLPPLHADRRPGRPRPGLLQR